MIEKWHYYTGKVVEPESEKHANSAQTPAPGSASSPVDSTRCSRKLNILNNFIIIFVFTV